MVRIGHGYDVHRFAPDRKLMLGAVEIPHTRGLLGHSDADVLLHAIADALLGAAALGDIGELFPDDAEENRGRDSAEILSLCNEAVEEAGWQVSNLDCVVCAERPKLGGLKKAMRDRIAAILGIKPDQVNVKAKTGEKVGPVGRLEAIEARAVVLLEPLEE